MAFFSLFFLSATLPAGTPVAPLVESPHHLQEVYVIVQHGVVVTYFLRDVIHPGGRGGDCLGEGGGHNPGLLL